MSSVPSFPPLLHDTDLEDEISGLSFPAHSSYLDELTLSPSHGSHIPTSPPGPGGFTPAAYRQLQRHYEALLKESNDDYRRLRRVISSSLSSKL